MIKYKENAVMPHIKHDLRDKPEGASYGNESIDLSLTKNNYSLVDRGRNAKEVNAYRKNLEKELFVFNRSNLIHGIEICIHCPSDCPEEQEKDFFKEVFNFVCGTLPMGEKCVLVAQVHKDERHYSPSGEMISHNHIHIMFTPAVKDKKHTEYEYKLCANEIITRRYLLSFYPNLQKHLDNCGINANVYKNRKGKNIPLTVSQLKDFTAKTGIVLKDGFTIDTLTEIVQDYSKQLDLVQNSLENSKKKDAEITRLKETLSITQSFLEASEKNLRESNQKIKDMEVNQKTYDKEKFGWGNTSSNWGILNDEEEMKW